MYSNAPVPHPETDSAQIVDFRGIKNWVTFAIRAVKRHRRVFFGTAAGMLLVATLVAQVLPKTYRVQCKLLAQRNSALALRGEASSESPTRSAPAMVLKRENVLAVIERTNLVKAWRSNRTFLQRMKDQVMRWVSKPPDEKQLTNGLADYLETKIAVWNDESTVTFQVDWRDPLIAYRLADAIQRQFLETRHVQEVSALAESASILEGRAATVRGEIDVAVTRLQTLRERKTKEEKDKPAPSAEPKPEAPRAPMAAAPQQPPAESPEVVQSRERRMSELKVMIEAKERTIADLDGFRTRRLSELQAKLQDLRAVYTEQHPAVTDLQQQIIGASQESPQVTHLRAEVKQLKAEYDGLRVAAGAAPARGGGGGFRSSGPGGEGKTMPDVIRIERESGEDRDPDVEYARSQLRYAIENYQRLQDEIGRTLIDLKTAEAAFKYRYTLVVQPEVPKGPVSPKVPLILLASVLGGLLIGAVGAVALELQAGTLYAAWQLEQGLSLRVVSHLSLPAGGRSRSP